MSMGVYIAPLVRACLEFECYCVVCMIWLKKTLKKFEKELNCSICMNIYSDPKLLQCLHAYCRKCLVKLVVRDQQGQLILSCPMCRHDTPVPANGVAGLQPAFQINHFLEIIKEHKEAAADPPVSDPRRPYFLQQGQGLLP